MDCQASSPWLVALGLLGHMLQKSLQSNTILMNAMVTAVASSWSLASHIFSMMQELSIPYSQVSFGAVFSENWARSLNLLQKMSGLQLQLDLISRSALMKFTSWQQSVKINEDTRASGIRPNAQFLSISITAAMGEGYDDNRWSKSLELFASGSSQMLPDSGNYNSLLFASSEWRISSGLLLKMRLAGLEHTPLGCKNYLQTLRNSQSSQSSQSSQRSQLWQVAVATTMLSMNNANLQGDLDAELLLADLSPWPSCLCWLRMRSLVAPFGRQIGFLGLAYHGKRRMCFSSSHFLKLFKNVYTCLYGYNV